MLIVQDKGGAIALMLAALCFLGTWPAILNLVERRGRHLVHTYLDYSITNYLAAIFIAFTLGQIGSSTSSSPNFVAQLYQMKRAQTCRRRRRLGSKPHVILFENLSAAAVSNGPSVAFALVGGLVLSMGNLATQYAWPFVGLSITEVVTASITVVAGTTMNYFLDNRINRAEILFPGVGCFLIAVLLGSWLHKSYSSDNLAKIQDHAKLGSVQPDPESLEGVGPDGPMKIGIAGAGAAGAVLCEPVKAKAGSGAFLQELENQRALKATGATTVFGLTIVIFAGGCFSLFSPAFNLATNDQWHTLKSGVPHLVVYTAFFYFSTSAFVFGIVTNMILLYRPILGLPRSNFKAYLQDWQGRPWAFLAGLLCGFGNGFQFMGGQAAGYAAADAVQALPLVSTFWGVLLFKEYYRSSRKTYVLLAAMLLMFSAAVGILMGSSGHRKS